MMKIISEHVLSLRDHRRELIKNARERERQQRQQNQHGNGNKGRSNNKSSSSTNNNNNNNNNNNDFDTNFDPDEHPDVAPLPVLTVCMVPRVTALCIKFLENLEIRNLVKLQQCDVNFIPLEPDVLSLEYESAYREIACEGHNMPAYYVASALHKLQRDIIGLVPLVKGKGRLAKDVSEIMLRLRREAIVEGEEEMIEPGEESGESLVDAIVLLDREVDTITPFCTQLTYEGLTDEILGIKNGIVSIKTGANDADKEDYVSSEEDDDDFDHGDNNKRNTQSSTSTSKIIKSRLSSNDALFKEIRDLNFGKACTVLRDRSTEMQAHYQALKEGKVEDQNVSEIGNFVRKLKGNIGGAGLDLHSTLAKKLLDKSKSYWFMTKLEMERHCIEGGPIEPVIEQIEEMIYRGESWETAMKLACLASQTYGGLPEKKFDSIRRDVMHAYGAVGILNSIVLETAGLFYGKESSANSPYRAAFQNVKKPLKLVVDSVKEESAGSSDIAFAYSSSGYGPLSIRIIQNAIRGSWKHHEETLKILPGPSFEIGQSMNEYGAAVQTSANYHSLSKKISLAKETSSSSSNTNSSISENKKKAVVLVCFIGGVTSAEISCLRQMSKSSDTGVEFIVATTKIITGENLLRNINQKQELGIFDDVSGDGSVPWAVLGAMNLDS
jgi:vacuolar protein sorting-associated protein 33A